MDAGELHDALMNTETQEIVETIKAIKKTNLIN
jgi:hypothetical protein